MTTKRSKGMSCRRWVAAIAPAAAALALAAPASATKPTVSTGGAKSVTYDSATVAGTIGPGSEATSYYFQYGPTRLYGGQSAIASAGSGTKNVQVAQPLTGLQPLTVYHYRLVAVNAAGTTIGGDQTFQTTKVPLSLAILSAPQPVVFGSAFVVQGTLSGTLNAGRQVVLQGNPFPFNAGFLNVGNAELTNAQGGFSFTLLGAATSEQFRVVTPTNPPVISPIVTEYVAVAVKSHIGHARRHGYVRVYGTVTPAENGSQVAVLRITHGRGVLVGGTVLRAAGTSSTFSRVVPAHRGVYRVLVRVVGAPQVSNYGQPLLVG